LTDRRNFAKVTGIALALVALIFAFQALSHNHPNGQEQVTCQLCQIAHASVLATASVAVPVIVLVPIGPVKQPTLLIPGEDFSFPSPARAPPAEVLL
jgi:hypothetical protein